MVDPDAEQRNKLKEELTEVEKVKRRIKNQLSAPGRKDQGWVAKAKMKLRNLQTKSDKLKSKIGVFNNRLKAKRRIARKCNCSDEQPCPYMVAALKIISPAKFQQVLVEAELIAQQEAIERRQQGE